MKVIERITILLGFTNLSIWTYNHWEEFHSSSLLIGIISLLVGYIAIFSILWICMYSFAKELLKNAVEYLQKNYQLKAMEFNSNFYGSISRKFACYMLIGILIIDFLVIFNLKFSILSLVNNFLSGSGNGSGNE